MGRYRFYENSLSLGVKTGETLSYTVFCSHCGFEIQECLDIKSIKLLKKVIQESIKVNPIKKYTQTNWNNWIKTSRLIVTDFNNVWKELNKTRQNYFRKIMQEMWQKINDYDYGKCEYGVLEKVRKESWEENYRKRQRELDKELAYTDNLWKTLVKIKQKLPKKGRN